MTSSERTPTQWEVENPWEAALARNIGRAMVAARRNSGMSQEQLAVHLDISRNSIANYEVGRAIPRLGLLLRIAAALNTAPVALLYPNVSDELENNVDVLPGIETTGYQAAQWVSGLRHGFTDTTDGQVSAEARALFRKNTRLLELWRELDRNRKKRAMPTGPSGKLSAEQLQLAEILDDRIHQLEHELGIAAADG